MQSPVSLCIIVRDDPFLEQCLLSIKDFVKEIIIIDTGSIDHNVINIAKKYATYYEQYALCNDPITGLIENFAMARNYAFSKATQPYVMWCDSDDTIIGGEHFNRIISALESNKKDLKGVAFLFPYEYSYDQNGKVNCLHYRERLMTNKLFHWVNPVHECCVPIVNDGIAMITSDEVMWKHHRQFNPKITEPGRNLRILRKYVAGAGANDARQLYYLGLECQNTGSVDEAIQHLTKYVEISGWDDERCMATLKLSEIYQGRGDFATSIRWAFKTIEIQENWCEGYFALARAFYFLATNGGPNEMRNWQRCAHFAQTGLKLPPTKTVLFINPSERNVEIHRYLNMALNKMGDVKGALNSVEMALQNHPDDPSLAINRRLYKIFLDKQYIVESLNSLKNLEEIDSDIYQVMNALLHKQMTVNNLKSNNVEQILLPKKENGLDIVFFIGNGIENWSPDTIKITGMGGSETMAYELAKRLAALGHAVRVYSGVGAGNEKVYEGVQYLSTEKYQNIQCDVLICSRRADALADSFNIDAKLILLWVHDVWAINATNQLLLKADRVLALSEWHKQNLINAHNIHSEHVVVTRNGIDLNRFNKQLTRNQFKCINSSSPDRSWPILLDCWPHIKARVPKAELHLYYGFKNWEFSAQNDPGQKDLIARLKQQIQEMKAMGVVYHDRVHQDKLAEEFLASGVWIYPTWFSETSCITAMEAQAAGLRIITSSIAALNETVADRGIRIDGDWTSSEYKTFFIDNVVAALQYEDNSDRLLLQQYAKENFSLDKLAIDWNDMFYNLLYVKTKNPIIPYAPTKAYK